MLGCSCCSRWNGSLPRSPPSGERHTLCQLWRYCLLQAQSWVFPQAWTSAKGNFSCQGYIRFCQEWPCPVFDSWGPTNTWLPCLNLSPLSRAILALELPIGSAKALAATTLKFNLFSLAFIVPHECFPYWWLPVTFLHADLWLRVCFLGNSTSDTSIPITCWALLYLITLHMSSLLLWTILLLPLMPAEPLRLVTDTICSLNSMSSFSTAPLMHGPMQYLPLICTSVREFIPAMVVVGMPAAAYMVNSADRSALCHPGAECSAFQFSAHQSWREQHSLLTRHGRRWGRPLWQDNFCRY